MRTVTLGVLLCSGLVVCSAAEAASARRTGRAARAPKVEAVPAPPQANVGYVPAPRRTTPPALALRPEVSEGEWFSITGREQLGPNDLAGPDATVESAELAAMAARNNAAVGKLRERNLQDSPALVNSSLDRPLTEVSPDRVEMPAGFEFLQLGFIVSQSGQN